MRVCLFFHVPLAVERGLTEREWFTLICDLVKFYEGGLTLREAHGLSFVMLRKLNIEADRIIQKTKEAL